MRQFNMHDAKTNLSELVRLALEGEEIVLARNGKPLIRLVPVADDAGLRPIGLNALASEEVTEAFLAESIRPLSDNELGSLDELFPEKGS